jgi:hypothetical protein
MVGGLISRRFSLVLSLLLVSGDALPADEGYWLFDEAPTAEIADKYHVTLDAAWLGHLRGCVLKIGGGTGSFVSGDGLVLTNRHVVEGQLHTLSTPQHDYEEDGFHAATRRDELPCQGLEILSLQSTEDVTARVKAAISPTASTAEAEAQQRAIGARIEKESYERTGLTSEVVTLFGGARYVLYRYRKYSDVRLVFAPEHAMAAFGGDPDNFEFPRHDLDISLLRVYDHGHPLHPHDFLKWNAAGPATNEVIFVAGHPGLSQRLATMDDLTFQRDVRLPRGLEELERSERELNDFAAIDASHARAAAESIAAVANSRKAFRGFLAGLRNTDIWQRKADEETSFRALLAQHPEEQAALDAFAQIRQAAEADRANYSAYNDYERFAYRSDIFNLARTLVRAAAERAKPNGERLPAYRDSALPSLEFRLFSGRPFNPNLDVLYIRDGLESLVRDFGANDPLVQKLLAGKSPRARAEELVAGSRLETLEVRRQIYTGAEGGARSLNHHDDPLIVFAREMDAAARAARKIDDEDDVIRHRAYAVLYAARARLNRAGRYPDATGTLRLAFGTVTGYTAGGKFVAPITTFADLFAHSAAHGDVPPYRIARSWREAQPQLDPNTGLNFASTADILGGNSGSPVVNRAGEFVGIIFDGNEPSLAGRYLYDPSNNRAVAVDSAAISAALRKIYGAAELSDELESGRAR